MLRIRFENLPDSLEQIFNQAAPTLRQHHIISFTPLGVLYLLATHTETAPEVLRLTNQAVAELVLAKLQNKYSGTGQLTASTDTAELVDKAVELAGGVNQASVGHLLQAMCQSDTDAWTFLQSIGITEAMIRQRMTESPSGHMQLIDKLTSVVILPEEAIVETVSLTTTAQLICAAFRKRSITSAVISGFPGVGRHTLWRYIGQKMQAGQMRGFSTVTLRKLNWTALEAEQQPIEAVQKLAQNLTKCLVLIEDLTMSRLRVCMPLLRAQTPVIAITTPSEAKQMTDLLMGVANIISLREPRQEDLNSMLKLHIPQVAAHHNLANVQLSDQAIQMLMRYGPAVSGLSLPGGAIQLLDLAASLDGIRGDRVLELSDVAGIISQVTGVPVGALTRSEAEKLRRLPEILGDRVIGQHQAKTAMQRAIARARTNLRDKRRPIGVFAFLGPTGVGKTELVKALAEGMFDDEKMLTRIDMSEYREAHTVSRLIGAPPGYVGYEAGGQLTEAVHKNPFQVVLLDEIDKADPEVYNILLQVMDDGRLTDGKGRTVDFSHTIIIMTSNHGSSLIQAGIEAGEDFDDIRDRAIQWFKSQVRPEFFNRFDDIIVFEPISPENAEQILDLQIGIMVTKPFKENHGIEVMVSPAARTFLLEVGYSPEFGARPLKRAITQHIIDPLALKLSEGELHNIQHISCDKSPEGSIVFVERS